MNMINVATGRVRESICRCVIAAGILIASTGLVLASFESRSGGARADALGPGFSGFADSADAVFVNPAGLSQLDVMAVQGGYSKLYLGLSDGSNLSNGSFVFALPFNKGADGTAAFGLQTFSLAGYYSESEAGLYYGKRFADRLALGGGLKFLMINYARDGYTDLNQTFAGGLSRSNISADLSCMYFAGRHLSIGLAAADVNAPDMGLSTADRVSQRVLFGAAYRREDFAILSGAEQKRNDLTFSLGGERWFWEHRFGVRGSFSIGSRNLTGIAVGLGYLTGGISVDYSVAYPLSGIASTYGTHKVTFGYSFREKTVQQPALSSAQDGALEANRKFAAAEQSITAGDYTAAAELVNEAVRLDSSVSRYAAVDERLRLVTEYLQRGDKLGGKPGQIAREGVCQYVLQEEPKKAIDLLIYAYSLRSDTAPQLIAKAIARKHALQVPELAPGLTLVDQKLYVALEQFRTKRFYECVQLCQDALALDPVNITANKRIGSAYYMLKNWKQARRYWQKAVELSPQGKDSAKIRRLMKKLENQAITGELQREDLE